MFDHFSVRLPNLTVLLTGVLVSGVIFAATAAPSNSTTRSEPTRTPEPTHAPEPTATHRPEPTRTPIPTSTSRPEPTRTPVPTPTHNPEPTRTPVPTPTHNPEPTRTPVPTPTHKPEPTRTPEPTKKPEPTRTPEATKAPEPTRTPEPTKKPEPTRTPEATRTPEPTSKPEPTRTPAPTPRPTAVPTPAPGSIAFAEPTFSVNEGAGTARIYVRRVVVNGVGAAGAVTVRYQTTTGGTATAGSDYTVTTGTLSWADGDGSVKVFTIPITDDIVREPNETVNLRLYDLVGSGTIAPSRQTAVLTIIDNETGDIDTTAPTVTITSPAVNAHISNLNTITGTARDEGGSRLARVGVLICRLSDRKYWTGTEWAPRQVILETQLVGNNWSRSSGNPTSDDLGADFYQVTAVAYDGAGNSGHVSEQVSVDGEPPSITLSVPADGAHLRSLTRVAGTVSDADGEATVVVFLRRASDGKYWTGSAWGNSTALPVQLNSSGEWARTEWPALDVGNYSVTGAATDSVGNHAYATSNFSIFVQADASGGRA